MRIYSRDEFLKLPAGTVFAKGKPMYFESLSVKGDSLPNDFIYRQLVWFETHGDTGDEFDQMRRWDEMAENGASFPANSSYGRDGCFDSEDLFLVYERDDLVEMRGVLNAAINIDQPLPSSDLIDLLPTETLVGIVMRLTGGSVNPDLPRAQAERIKKTPAG